MSIFHVRDCDGAAAISSRLEAVARDVIEARGLTHEQLAVLFDMLPVGVEVVMSRTWTLNTSIAILDVLGFEVRELIAPKGAES